MNGTASISKKALPLVAVLILCAACLVTVAYAYSATYKDTVSESDIAPTENSKYIYITGEGLTYGENDIPATIDVTYTSSTEMGENGPVTKLTPNFYKISALEAPAKLSDDGVATIKIGSLTVKNVNTEADSVTLEVSGLTASEITNGKTTLFEDALTANCIKFTAQNGTEYATTFEFGEAKEVTVDVYVVKAVNLTPDPSVFNRESYVLNENGALTGTFTTTLVVPGFTIDVSATEGFPQIDTTGPLSAKEITAAKAAVSNGGDLTVKVKNSDGASIVMNSAAISTLGNATSALAVVESDVEVEGASAVYDISFGDNHFGNGVITLTVPYTLKEGESADGAFHVAYVNEAGEVSTTYPAVYADGYLTFSTDHLSTYAVKSGHAAPVSMELGGLSKYYATLVDAIAAVPAGATATVTLYQNQSGAGIFLGAADAKNITVDLGGFTYTCTGPAVGSVGTQSQAWHLEKGNTVLIKNGALTSEGNDVLMLIQNYCDLTLDGVTVSAASAVTYLVSNNFGSFTMINTVLNGTDSQIAFDLWYGMSADYDGGVTVNVVSGTVNGNVEYGAANRAKDTNWEPLTSLTIAEGVVFNDKIVPGNGNDLTNANVNVPQGWTRSATEIAPVEA